MRNSRLSQRAIPVFIAIALASCAQQPVHETPKSTAPTQTTPPTTKPDATPAAPKPKPKPLKPATPKPDPTKEVAAPDGIERSQVGYYFDTLQGRLRQLAQAGFVVNRNDGHISVDMTSRLQFDNGETHLAAASCAGLAPIAKALTEYRMTIAIAEIGAAGGDAVALKTARARADSVAKCIVDAGIDARRIESRGVTSSGSQAAVLRIEPIVKSP